MQIVSFSKEIYLFARKMPQDSSLIGTRKSFQKKAENEKHPLHLPFTSHVQSVHFAGGSRS